MIEALCIPAATPHKTSRRVEEEGKERLARRPALRKPNIAYSAFSFPSWRSCFRIARRN